MVSVKKVNMCQINCITYEMNVIVACNVEQSFNSKNEMNCTLCVLLMRVMQSVCTDPLSLYNQQYTKDEINFIHLYLHYFYVFGLCFINCNHSNGCVSLENPTVCTVKILEKIVLCDSNLVIIDTKKK